MYIYVNEELMPSNSRALKLTDGYSFGYGLFETVKVLDGELVFWQEHMERLARGLSKIGMASDLDRDDMEKSAKHLISLNKLEEGALKVIVSKSGDSRDTVLSTRVAEYPAALYERGFKLKLSGSRRNTHSLMPRLKSLNYMENMLERNMALKVGFDDCLFLNTEGYLAETSISNLFYVKDGSLYTPSLESGILDGIVRGKVISAAISLGLEVFEGEYSLEELLSSEEAFLTNSLMGLMPVSEIEDVKKDIKFDGVLGKLQRLYGDMLNAERYI
ncbi:aminodeoxychorismate lyase [Andreesenia angusta]|uniref:Aminodeoxychorismate lyase n=1 Tax=Andreesenia angusta TaxID=39480 RepID=A0A1S1V635_9FIRM|nr:aminotransferase class IV [Andreesenia angusta]OHW62093.1 aminodeoxychorismate lyase [Andreesenia angusta]